MFSIAVSNRHLKPPSKLNCKIRKKWFNWIFAWLAFASCIRAWFNKFHGILFAIAISQSQSLNGNRSHKSRAQPPHIHMAKMFALIKQRTRSANDKKLEWDATTATTTWIQLNLGLHVERWAQIAFVMMAHRDDVMRTVSNATVVLPEHELLRSWKSGKRKSR